MILDLGTVQSETENCVLQFRTEPVDPAQLTSIQSVHRGFLYQHLYSVGCLLNLLKLNDGTVRVERDEDLEVAAEDRKLFVQIKTRSRPLAPSDIEGSLENFEAIRTHYSRSAHEHKTEFVIVSNVELGVELERRNATGEYPSDVRFVLPSDKTISYPFLPPAWQDVNEGLKWCTKTAESAPFSSLIPETLVWKLAARVQFAATGEDADHRDHAFTRSSVQMLIEQYIEQLQDFPEIPDDYRPQINEPPLRTPHRIRLVSGLTGSGKTIWASWHSRHSSKNCVYFDVGGLPGQSVATSLAREMAARFLRPLSKEAAQLPAVAGLDLLRAACRRINLPEPPLVVLDNIHRLSVSDMRHILAACPNVYFILLCQPWQEKGALESHLQIESEQLQGWDEDTIAAVFADTGTSVSPQVARKWQKITAGIPLFVKNAAMLAARRTDGCAAKLADEVETGSHHCELAQENLLRMTLEVLNDVVLDIVEAFSLSEIPLSYSEVGDLLGALKHNDIKLGSIMRDLKGKGILQVFGNGKWKIHDAMRAPLADLPDRFSADQIIALQIKLRDILLGSFREVHDLGRLKAWMRLLAPTGEVETLVDISTHEWFHEFGDPDDLKAILVSVVESLEESEELRFWALDALVFWDFTRADGHDDAFRYLVEMEHLVNRGNLGEREQVAFALKRILQYGYKGDVAAVDEAYQTAEPLISQDRELSRIARYNYATALFRCGLPKRALALTEPLYMEYYDLFDLHPQDVFLASNKDVYERVSRRLGDWDGDTKRLADCLNLAAMCKRKNHESPRFTAIHAAKFYTVSGSYRSALKVNMDLADDFIDIGDAQSAREVLESNAIPLLRHAGLISLGVEVRSLYAVILAYCGDFQRARAEMASLAAYEGSLSERERAGVQDQRQLIEDIETGRVVLPERPSNRRFEKKEKTGRNAPCPCGSGKKFKKCCIGKTGFAKLVKDFEGRWD